MQAKVARFVVDIWIGNKKNRWHMDSSVHSSQQESWHDVKLVMERQESAMIILPTTTPAANIERFDFTQHQQQHIQNSEQSRKATDTVQLSTQARKLAGSHQHQQTEAVITPATIQLAADNEVAEKVADNEVIEQQRPSNPVTHQPNATKIDIVA